MYKYAVQKVNSYSSIVRLSKQRKQTSRDDWRDKTRGGHDGLHVIYAEICYLCNIC